MHKLLILLLAFSFSSLADDRLSYEDIRMAIITDIQGSLKDANNDHFAPAATEADQFCEFNYVQNTKNSIQEFSFNFLNIEVIHYNNKVHLICENGDQCLAYEKVSYWGNGLTSFEWGSAQFISIEVADFFLKDSLIENFNSILDNCLEEKEEREEEALNKELDTKKDGVYTGKTPTIR